MYTHLNVLTDTAESAKLYWNRRTGYPVPPLGPNAPTGIHAQFPSGPKSPEKTVEAGEEITAKFTPF